MIQFNLLPDVKLAFIRAQRLKRVISVISIAVTAASLVLAILIFSVVRLQTVHMDNLDDDIKSSRKELEETPDLEKVLTIQNQLDNITALHDKKVIMSRLKEYVAQVTPTNVTYAEIQVKNDTSTLVFTGATDSLRTVNQFVDTLKFTNFTIGNTDQKSAFSDVVLSKFGRDDKGASFEVTLKFDPAIFALHIDDQSDETPKPPLLPKLVVPSIISTRSVTERPNEALFQPLSNPEEVEENNE